MQALIEVQNAYALGAWAELQKILYLIALVNKLRIAFLDLNERHMLVNGGPHQRISLMMLLHQHLQARVRHAEEVGKLLWIAKLRLKYRCWLILNLFSKFIDLLFSSRHDIAKLIQLLLSRGVSRPWLPSLHLLPLVELFLFVLGAGVRPLILHLIMQQSVRFLNVLAYRGVFCELLLHQQFHHVPQEGRSLLNAFDFYDVGIPKVRALQVQARSSRHLVHDGLYQPLLLKNVADVLVTLQICIHKLQLGLLILCFVLDCLIKDSESVDAWVDVGQVALVDQRLQLIDVEGTDFEDFFL